MKDLVERLTKYAGDNPVKFVALSSFCSLGAIPLLAFVAYGVATVIASLIGAVVMELFLLAVGITGLAFVLFFVTCISVCATSIFGAVYLTYRAAASTLHRGKDFRYNFSRTPVWPFSSTTDPNEPQSGEQGVESDKKK